MFVCVIALFYYKFIFSSATELVYIHYILYKADKRAFKVGRENWPGAVRAEDTVVNVMALPYKRVIRPNFPMDIPMIG